MTTEAPKPIEDSGEKSVAEMLKEMSQRLDTQQRIIEDQAGVIDRLKNPGIKAAQKKGADKPIKHNEFPMDTVQGAERELRTYIRKQNAQDSCVYTTGPNKGKKIKRGFRRGITEEQKERTKKLLEILDRKGLYWDEDILDFDNHLPPEFYEQAHLQPKED